MNDLIRPALYDAHHAIQPLTDKRNHPMAPADVVGPVCESSDTFARARALPPLAEGELLAFGSAGAYGAVMASTYNSRLLVPEVLIDGDRFAVVRPRPSYAEMLGQDRIPEWLTASAPQGSD
jgi:diaminopimelate decarboxylase